MTIAILGPHGQLGGDLCDVLKERGKAYSPVDRLVLDVSDPQAVTTALAGLEFDTLVNCTSYHKTDEVEDQPAKAIAVNAHAVEAMAKAAALKGARFVTISTDYVFGGDVGRAEPLDETAAVAPVNVYGLSKCYGETLARLAYPDTLVFRVASLFGVRGASGKGGNFVETMIRLAKERGKLTVVSDQKMSPTSTRTIAECIVSFLESSSPPGVYHCVNSGEATWHQFAQRIVERCGLDVEVTPCFASQFPTRARRPSYSVLDNTKLTRILGPIAPWEEALDVYLRAKGHR